MNIDVKGNVSTLHWVESELKYPEEAPGKDMCQVSYSAINQRDVLYALGRLALKDLPGKEVIYIFPYIAYTVSWMDAIIVYFLYIVL